MSITATKKKTQKQALLSWLKRHRSKGITTMEAFEHLKITCVHKRISEIEDIVKVTKEYPFLEFAYRITRTKERTATGSTVTRYKLAR